MASAMVPKRCSALRVARQSSYLSGRLHLGRPSSNIVNCARCFSSSSSRLHVPDVPLPKAVPLSQSIFPPTSIPSVPSLQYFKKHISQEGGPTVFTFFHQTSATWTYVVVDPATNKAVIIDPVLDYDNGVVDMKTAAGLLGFVKENGFEVDKIIDTHAHADHLTSAAYIKSQLGPSVQTCIGRRILEVQETFREVYSVPREELGAQCWDKLFEDNEVFKIGTLDCKVVHLPGHTPDSMGFLCVDAIFAGDSIFLPDVGSARADFPGGSVDHLWSSAQKLLALPDHYKVFSGHDYPGADRSESCFSTVGEQKTLNKHLKAGTDIEEFTEMRRMRDLALDAPKMIHPSIQVNIRGGMLPAPDEEGRIFFKIPITVRS